MVHHARKYTPAIFDDIHVRRPSRLWHDSHSFHHELLFRVEGGMVWSPFLLKGEPIKFCFMDVFASCVIPVYTGYI